MRHTNAAVEEAGEYSSLELRGIFRAGNISLGVIDVMMLLKTRGIDGIYQEESM